MRPSGVLERIRSELPDVSKAPHADPASQAKTAGGTRARRPEVVIIGGGFGGLAAAQTLAKSPVRVTVIDKANHHVFQPLLYQVATGGLSPANIASPLRHLLRRQRNARVLMGDVRHIDIGERVVVLGHMEIPYDYLVLATGARHDYFGNDQWETYAPGLKTLEDATEIRRRVLCAFEAAEVEDDREATRELLTFVVVGAGPTGVELAGAVAELAKDTMRNEFRAIDPGSARILLIDALPRVLPPYTEKSSARATRALQDLGVEVMTEAMLTNVTSHGITVRRGEKEEEIGTSTILWAAGVRASPLGKSVAEQAGGSTDRAGRVVVDRYLNLPGRPDVFVIGDLARIERSNGELVPGIAPAAISAGKYVADTIANRVKGKSVSPFKYRDRGKMATIGRGKAVAEMGRFKLSGFIGWFAWLVVHLRSLARFENQLLVFTQWAWNYSTNNRSARLILQRR